MSWLSVKEGGGGLEEEECKQPVTFKPVLFIYLFD